MLHFSCAWAVVPECVAYAERRESHKSPDIYSKGVAFKTDPYILRVNSLSIDFIISIINNVGLIEAKPSRNYSSEVTQVTSQVHCILVIIDNISNVSSALLFFDDLLISTLKIIAQMLMNDVD